ncbi:MAG: chromate transporter [Eubacteriales bacterium]
MKETKSRKRSEPLRLFLIFLKIGAFTFGGGYAMIPVIERELVDKRKMVEHGDLLDVIAIAESTPGPIAVNAATFIGMKCAGFAGALLATVGVVLPAFFIMLIVSALFQAFRSLKVVSYAFMGIRAGVLALIVRAAVTMFKACPKEILGWILMAFSFIAVAFLKINTLAVILVCALVGLSSVILVRFRQKDREQTEKREKK